MVTTTVEPLIHLLGSGLVELAYEAHQELELEHLEQPFDPDWAAYQEKENSNSLRFFALREKGNLIGYCSVIVDTDIHRKGVIIAIIRDIFLTKKKRGYARTFEQNIEKIIKPLGAERLYAAVRVNSPDSFEGFLRAVGFEPQECLLAKTLH